MSIKQKRELYAKIMKGAMYLSTGIVIAITLSFVIYIFYKGLGHITMTLLFTSPSYLDERIGILPDILNTIYVVFTTLIFVVPLGMISAIYLNEYPHHRWWIQIMDRAIETLAGIPSIIFGLVGMLFFCQFLGFQTSILAGSLTLVIMNLPIMIRTCVESLKTVPQSYREGAFGLGAGRFVVIWTVVLPSCIDGIFTGMMLSIGRILSESAALLFTAGLAHQLSGYFDGLFRSGSTLTVALYVYAKEQGEFDVAFAIAAILLILIMVIHIITQYLYKRIERRIHV